MLNFLLYPYLSSPSCYCPLPPPTPLTTCVSIFFINYNSLYSIVYVVLVLLFIVNLFYRLYNIFCVSAILCFFFVLFFNV